MNTPSLQQLARVSLWHGNCTLALQCCTHYGESLNSVLPFLQPKSLLNLGHNLMNPSPLQWRQCGLQETLPGFEVILERAVALRNQGTLA